MESIVICSYAVLVLNVSQHPEDYLHMAKHLGAQYTFTKPFEPFDLLAAVIELLKCEKNL